jgi:hypothetical protein
VQREDMSLEARMVRRSLKQTRQDKKMACTVGMEEMAESENFKWLGWRKKLVINQVGGSEDKSRMLLF